MNKNFQDLSIHEAGHFIAYLLNCFKACELPQVHEIVTTTKHGHVARRGSCSNSPGFVEAVLISNATPEMKEAFILSVKREIKVILSGIAGELIQSKLEHRANFALTLYYTKDKKDLTSDLFKAVYLNTAIGGQTKEDGALPLLSLLQEAISDISPYWDNVLKVAGLLDENKTIEGEQLESLINDFNLQLESDPEFICLY